MITLHLLENSRAQRVAWLLEEMGTAYEVVSYARDRGTLLAPAALREIHPLGKSPVITDGDTTVAESGAIIDYLVRTYGDGRFVPDTDSPDYIQYQYWMHAAEGSLMPVLLMSLVTMRMRKKAPLLIRPFANMIAGELQKRYVAPNLKSLLAFMDDHLSRNEWFAGRELTGADIQMGYPLQAIESRVGFGPEQPHLAAYVEKIKQRPAYQRALKRTGGLESLTS